MWKAEEFDLTKAVIDAITMLTTTGAQAGELASGIYIGVSSRSQTVLVAAREQVATLVSQGDGDESQAHPGSDQTVDRQGGRMSPQLSNASRLS